MNVIAVQVNPSTTRYIDLSKVESIIIQDEDGDGSNDCICFFFISGKGVCVTCGNDGFYHTLDDVTEWLEERMKP